MEWKSMGRMTTHIYIVENKSHVWNHQAVMKWLTEIRKLGGLGSSIYSQGSPSAVWAWSISSRRTENQRLTHMRRVGLGTPSLSVGTSVSYSWTSKHIGPRLEWCMDMHGQWWSNMVNDGQWYLLHKNVGKRDDPSTGFRKSYIWVVIQCHPPN